MKKILITISLLYCSNVFADVSDFEQFVIAPPSTEPFKGTIFFGDYLNVEPDALCNTKKVYPNKLTVIDQEGGVVARLGVPGATPMKPIEAVKHGLDAFKKSLDGVGSVLAQNCLDVDLAPVADTNFTDSYWNRSYSSDSNIVNQYATIFTQALNKQNIIATWKHFPGYTNNVRPIDHHSKLYTDNYNPDFSEPAIDLSDKDYLDRSMQSFRSNAHNYLMINTGLFSAYENKPAIFSDEVIAKAHAIQPKSLLISDDIDVLKIDDSKLLYLFKNIDLYIFSSNSDALKFSESLEKLYHAGKITNEDLINKKLRIAKFETKITINKGRFYEDSN
jgi:beta-N-acetylhexosaminidase